MRKSNRVDLERQIKEKQMGRPLKKDVYGTQVLGLPGLSTNTLAGIAVSGYFGGALSTSYVLIKQRGAQSFVVAKIESFTCNTTSGSTSITNMSDQIEVTVGDEISGVGIPSGAVIQSLDSATTATHNKVHLERAQKEIDEINRVVDIAEKAQLMSLLSQR